MPPLTDCLLVEATVAASFGLPRAILKAPSRCPAQVAFARQIAMYTAHIWLGLNLTEVGRHFHRDRTTVAHACKVVEDRRDNPQVDRIVSAIEATVCLWRETSQMMGDT
jgi:chromosomal replication initiation ATPase DnaA